MRRKDYGLVTARIDDDRRRVVLSFPPRKRGKLGDTTRRRCVDWALSRLGELRAQGYDIDASKVQR